jgi:hypothetical protein
MCFLRRCTRIMGEQFHAEAWNMPIYYVKNFLHPTFSRYCMNISELHCATLLIFKVFSGYFTFIVACLMKRLDKKFLAKRRCIGYSRWICLAVLFGHSTWSLTVSLAWRSSTRPYTRHPTGIIQAVWLALGTANYCISYYWFKLRIYCIEFFISPIS